MWVRVHRRVRVVNGRMGVAHLKIIALSLFVFGTEDHVKEALETY